jgi:hypothetical protein
MGGPRRSSAPASLREYAHQLEETLVPLAIEQLQQRGVSMDGLQSMGLGPEAKSLDGLQVVCTILYTLYPMHCRYYTQYPIPYALH